MEDGSGMYQQHGGGTPRSHSTASTASSVSPSGNAATPMLVVPHPINASKITDAHHVVTHQNGGGRKYTCKMCPSVSVPLIFYFFKYYFRFGHRVFFYFIKTVSGVFGCWYSCTIAAVFDRVCYADITVKKRVRRGENGTVYAVSV